MLVTIGKEINKIIILPAKTIFSPMLELPTSLHNPALNSVKYPTPIIFKTIFNKPISKPVLLNNCVNTETISKI